MEREDTLIVTMVENYRSYQLRMYNVEVTGIVLIQKAQCVIRLDELTGCQECLSGLCVPLQLARGSRCYLVLS